MTNPIFKSAVQPELCPEAQKLVTTYDSTPGSSGPYCCSHALAAVLDRLAEEMHDTLDADILHTAASELRGEAP